jgi:hypothetical protein
MYCFVSTVFFYVLFVCKCVLYYCHRVSTQLQLKYIITYFTVLRLQCLYRRSASLFHSRSYLVSHTPFLHRDNYYSELFKYIATSTILWGNLWCIENWNLLFYTVLSLQKLVDSNLRCEYAYTFAQSPSTLNLPTAFERRTLNWETLYKASDERYPENWK